MALIREHLEMCGIAGFILNPGGLGLAAEEQQAHLEAMLPPLAHRGPDGQGLWVEGPAALGHRRLAIIDLMTGGQPMLDAKKRAAVVFNGEIYNFREIRRDLEAKGYVFKTRSDTEVLLNAYLDQGVRCLDLFEGMFAFALWDRRKRRLFAARDRFGKKPFYYTQQNGVFAFASELTALKRLPFLKFRVETGKLAGFLVYGYIPTPDAVYQGVKKLRPGHYLLLKDGRVRTAAYWDLPLPDEGEEREADLEERLRELLVRAVRRRLVSDVPLGVFLSGGLDSSTVTALMAGLTSEVKTFSIGFEERFYDESSHARRIARRFGTDHHEHILSAARCGELLPGIVARLDEPLADPAIVPTYLLCQVTRRHVTVALGGEGSDELFAGYEQYPGMKVAEFYRRLPQGFRRHMEALSRRLPSRTGGVDPRLLARWFIMGAEAPPWLRLQIWFAAFLPEVQEELWRAPETAGLSPEKLFGVGRALYDRYPAATPLDRVFYVFARQYLLDNNLAKVDRCSMLHSLEVRAPFLDREVAEFVSRLPTSLKIRGFRRKYLLKRAVRPLLPGRNIYRFKQGFTIPTGLWLTGVLRPLVEEYLGERWLKSQGLFRPDTVGRLVREHFTGRVDHRMELWTLLVLQLWLHHHRPEIV